MKDRRIVTDKSDLFDVQREIKTFVKEHKAPLSDADRNVLGDLLDRRAQAISEVLGVTVHSIGDPRDDR